MWEQDGAPLSWMGDDGMTETVVTKRDDESQTAFVVRLIETHAWNEAIEAAAKMADDMDDDGTFGSCIRTLKRPNDDNEASALTGEG